MQRTAPPTLVAEHELTLDAVTHVLALRDRDSREHQLHQHLKALSAKLAAGVVLHPAERGRLDAIVDELLRGDIADRRELGLLYEIVYRAGSVFEFCRQLWQAAMRKERRS